MMCEARQFRLFPYTTLFRSCELHGGRFGFACGDDPQGRAGDVDGDRSPSTSPARPCGSSPHARSEEHTSELQSHSDLVCRLLLEKKKKKKSSSTVINLLRYI